MTIIKVLIGIINSSTNKTHYYRDGKVDNYTFHEKELDIDNIDIVLEECDNYCECQKNSIEFYKDQLVKIESLINSYETNEGKICQIKDLLDVNDNTSEFAPSKQFIEMEDKYELVMHVNRDNLGDYIYITSTEDTDDTWTCGCSHGTYNYLLPYELSLEYPLNEDNIHKGFKHIYKFKKNNYNNKFIFDRYMGVD